MSRRQRKYFDSENGERDIDIGAQPCDYISVGVRMEGDPEKIRELIRRLQLVGDVRVPSTCYVNDRSPYGVQVYARVNLNGSNETNSLYDRLQAIKFQYNQLEAEIGETVVKLKQEVKKVLKPRPWDAVLGGQSEVGDRIEDEDEDWIVIDDED